MHLPQISDRWLNLAGFLLILCCFALPFNGWSTDPCTTIKLTYRGTDLVVGAAVEVTADSCHGRDTMPEPRTDRVQRTFPPLTELQPYAVTALALVVLGVALAALPWRRTRAADAAAAAAASAAACFITATVWASMDVPFPYLGFTKAVRHDIPLGACLAFVLLVALAVWNLGSAARSLRSPSRSPGDRGADDPSHVGDVT